MMWRAVLTLFVLAVAGTPAPPAAAQGFFDQLFGSSGPSPTERSLRGANRYQSFGGGPYGQSGLTYRTLCVRLCDGYYFPISFSAPRSALSRDADQCSASCGSEARLFYHPNPGGDIDTMVDLTGLSYGALPTAFKYRKTLVKGCACRPQPWSEAELQRHRRYASGEQVAAASETAREPFTELEPIVEKPDQTQLAVVISQPLPVVRPAPLQRQSLSTAPQSFGGSSFGGGSSVKPHSSKTGSPGGLFR
jgi:hypothetical protein